MNKNEGIAANFFCNYFPPLPNLEPAANDAKFAWMAFYCRQWVIIAPMFRDLPIVARELKATPEVLERVYQASRLGLRGDALALRAGMLPVEFARLKLMDPMADMAEMKGRADAEGDLATTLMEAAIGGDTKAALEVLKHRHDWVARQQVQVDVSQSISITAALEQAERRVRKAEAIEDAVEVTPAVRLDVAPVALPAEGAAL